MEIVKDNTVYRISESSKKSDGKKRKATISPFLLMRQKSFAKPRKSCGSMFYPTADYFKVIL